MTRSPIWLFLGEDVDPRAPRREEGGDRTATARVETKGGLIWALASRRPARTFAKCSFWRRNVSLPFRAREWRLRLLSVQFMVGDRSWLTAVAAMACRACMGQRTRRLERKTSVMLWPEQLMKDYDATFANAGEGAEGQWHWYKRLICVSCHECELANSRH